MALINIDVTNVEPQRSFEPLPAGTYTAQITDSDLHPTKAGNGHYLKLEFTVLGAQDPNLVGRKLWTNLNLDNPNAQAVEIAYSELSAIAHAVGKVGKIDDSQVLHGIPMDIDVSVREDTTGRYQPQNEIKGYRPCANAAPTPAPAQAAAGSVPPWAKKTG